MKKTLTSIGAAASIGYGGGVATGIKLVTPKATIKPPLTEQSVDFDFTKLNWIQQLQKAGIEVDVNEVTRVPEVIEYE